VMTPEEVLLEAIAAASVRGDSPSLRQLMCSKLAASIAKQQVAVTEYSNRCVCSDN